MSNVVLAFINGHAGVGKDTFVRFCREYAEEKGLCRVYNIHRSDAPKIALQNLGWNGEKDIETRDLLKHMVDFMESKGLLDKYLNANILAARRTNTCDSIVFYHVRDPEVMYGLMDDYMELKNVRPISLLIQRDIEHPAEPDEWWGNLENGDYTVTIELPKNDLHITRDLAENFVEFLLSPAWEVRKQEEATWITNT